MEAKIECRMHFFNTMGQCAVCMRSGRRFEHNAAGVFCCVLNVAARVSSTLNLWPFIDHFYIIPSFYCTRKSARFKTSSNVEFFIGFRISFKNYFNVFRDHLQF